MSDILSQEEVDALLNAVSTGSLVPEAGNDKPAPLEGGMAAEETDKDKSVTLYDFRRPDRVSKDQMRTLQNLHDGYARLLSTTLSSYLRTLVEIDIVSVDQLTYSEFMMSISNPSCIYVFQMEPLEGAAIFEVNPSLVFFIVDRLFGGQGKPTEHNRELTDIEKNVLTKIVESGNPNVLLTERGASFGYNNLVSDMRSLAIMRETNCPVVFDATHSVQLPGGQGDKSGGQREHVPVLARAAIAAGVAGVFMETHPNPAVAMSDGPNAWPLPKMRALLATLKQLDDAVKAAGLAELDL